MQLMIIFALALSIVAVIFALQNPGVVALTFFGWKFNQPLAVYLLVSMAIGALIVSLLTIPTRFKGRKQTKKFNKETEELEDNLSQYRSNLIDAQNSNKDLRQKILEIEDAKEEVEQQLAQTKAESEATLNKTIDEYEKTLAKTIDEYEKTLSRTKAEYEETLSKFHDDSAEILTKTKDQYEQTLTQTKDQYEQTLSRNQQDYDHTLTQTQEDHERTLNQTKENYEAALAKTNTEIEELRAALDKASVTAREAEEARGIAEEERKAAFEARDNAVLAQRELEIKLSSAETNAGTYKGMLEQMAPAMPYIQPGSGADYDVLNEEAQLDLVPDKTPEEPEKPEEPEESKEEPKKEEKKRFSWF